MCCSPRGDAIPIARIAMREIYKSLSRAPARRPNRAPESRPRRRLPMRAPMRANDGRPFARVRPRVRSINPSIARIDARAHPSIARIDRAMRAHRSRASGDSTAWSRFADAMFYVWGSRTAGPTDRRTRGRRFWRERARARSDAAMAIFVRACVVDFVCASSARAVRGSRSMDVWMRVHRRDGCGG